MCLSHGAEFSTPLDLPSLECPMRPQRGLGVASKSWLPSLSSHNVFF